jgi:ribose transport system permease protein
VNQPQTSARGAFVGFVASPAGRALLALLLVLLLGAIFHADGAFFKIGTHRDALRQVSVYGILACGMTLVIITGGIDLSVGSVLGLTGVCFSLMLADWGWSPWLAVPVCLAIGAACGGVSGVLTARFAIQPFIATLAMMVFARGVAKYVSEGKKIPMLTLGPDGVLQKPAFIELIRSRVLGENLAVVTVILLACAGLAWIAMARHRWGRELYAIGGNEEAARLSGVAVAMSKTLAYVACGALSAVAGICQAAQDTQGDPEAGFTYELTAIAVVVIGGTNLMGGRGGIGLTLIGTLTIGYLEKILSVNNVPEAGRLMLTGVIIVAAVLTQRRRR